MNRLFSWLVVFGILAAGAIGLGLSGVLVRSSPAVVAAVARQEAAKAASLEAQADADRARTAEAWVNTEARRQALPEIARGIRWTALGTGIAVAVLLVGGAMAAVTWGNTRARVVYPDRRGMWPLIVDRSLRGGTVVIDTGRALGPVTIVRGGDDVFQPLPGSEAAALQLSTQAQAAGVMIGIAGKDNSGDVAARIRRATGNLPAPTFASAPAGDSLRLAYVKTPGMGNSAAARELQDLKEFIELGQNGRGLARKAWVGQSFSKSGNRCTRSYYDSIAEKLSKAGALTKKENAWVWAVDEREALDAFGLAHEGGEENQP